MTWVGVTEINGVDRGGLEHEGGENGGENECLLTVSFCTLSMPLSDLPSKLLQVYNQMM
jgi:hypothetical protein